MVTSAAVLPSGTNGNGCEGSVARWKVLGNKEPLFQRLMRRHMGKVEQRVMQLYAMSSDCRRNEFRPLVPPSYTSNLSQSLLPYRQSHLRSPTVPASQQLPWISQSVPTMLFTPTATTPSTVALPTSPSPLMAQTGTLYVVFHLDPLRVRADIFRRLSAR